MHHTGRVCRGGHNRFEQETAAPWFAYQAKSKSCASADNQIGIPHPPGQRQSMASIAFTTAGLGVGVVDIGSDHPVDRYRPSESDHGVVRDRERKVTPDSPMSTSAAQHPRARGRAALRRPPSAS